MTTKKQSGYPTDYISKKYQLEQIVENNDFLLLEFDDLEKAKKWAQKKFSGEKKVWATQYPKTSICSYLSHTNQDITNYTGAKIVSIIDKNQIEQFKQIHPIWFQFVKAGLDNRQSEWVALNATPEQICFWPKTFFKKLSIKALRILKERCEGTDYYSYNLYRLGPGAPSSIFALIKQDYVVKQLNIQIRYRKINSVEINENRKYDLNNPKLIETGIMGKDIADYLQIAKVTFYNNRQKENKEKGRPYSNLFLSLKEKESLAGGATYFTVDSFKNALKENYYPAKGVIKDESRYAPIEGYYKAADLYKMYGVKFSLILLNKAVLAGEIGCLHLMNEDDGQNGLNSVRYTKRDFEEFLEMRQEKITVKKPRREKEAVTFASDEKEREFIANHFSTRDILAMLEPYTNSNLLGSITVFCKQINFMAGKPYVYLVSRESEKPSYNTSSVYYKAEDVKEAIGDNYGYINDKIINDKKKKSIELKKTPIEITKDTRFISISEMVKELTQQHPKLVAANVQNTILRHINNGKIPVLVLSERIRLLRREDVLNNKQMKRYIGKF